MRPTSAGEALVSSRRMPAYEQAAATLEAEIRSGRLGAEERLLSERALAERLRVSRITIRRALARLAEKDLVRSSERSGWFTVPVSHGSTAMISFTDQGRLRGFAVTSRVLRCATREATLDEAEELGIAPGIRGGEDRLPRRPLPVPRHPRHRQEGAAPVVRETR